MIKLKHVPTLVASCLLIGGFALDAAAQDRDQNRDRGWRERDDGERGWRGRDRDDDDDDDRDRRWRGRDRNDDDDRGRRGRGRDRDDDDDRRGREWRGYYDRGSNCYYVRRRIIDRDGDVIIRRSRVCED